MINQEQPEATTEAELVDALAELTVRLGANLQPGQILSISSEPGKEPLARAIADAAYRHGALYVDLSVFDPHLKRSRALHADPDTLEFVPPWLGARALAIGEHRCAPGRADRTGGAAASWTGSTRPCSGSTCSRLCPRGCRCSRHAPPTGPQSPARPRGWATLVHPDLEPGVALARLWREVAHICRLDEPDPVAAWKQRLANLSATAARLDELGLDALRFDGPGTELTIGLLTSGRWAAARFETVDGIVHAPNLPTEEVFTTPDPERVDGFVTRDQAAVHVGDDDHRAAGPIRGRPGGGDRGRPRRRGAARA